MGNVVEVKVPDIGDFKNVEIIDVLVKAGDAVKAEDPLITLESDKASIDIPSPGPGIVKALKVKKGDRVSEGDAVLDMEAETDASPGGRSRNGAEAPSPATPAAPAGEGKEGKEGKVQATEQSDAPLPAEPAARPAGPRPSPTAAIVNEEGFRKAHASPAVRRFARELGVDLGSVEGSGPKNRILREDVQSYVKRALVQGGGLGVAPMPEIDFSQFGPVETQALTRINRLTGQNLHRNWVT